MGDGMISIDELIDIVRAGGRVKTGVDVYNNRGILLLSKDVLVDKTKPLEIIKENGIRKVPIQAMGDGGLWDENGRPIPLGGGTVNQNVPVPSAPSKAPDMVPKAFRPTDPVEKRLEEIAQIKAEAALQHARAKECIKTAMEQIQESGGEFDVPMVREHVDRLSRFLVTHDHPFSYLNREIFSHDEYLFNHSINVCATATAVLHQFNSNFSKTITGLLSEHQPFNGYHPSFEHHFQYYYPDEMEEMSMGFFLYDIGKVNVPHGLLNKKHPLTAGEFDVIRRHSYEFGLKILDKNHIQSAFIRNIVAYHHGPLYEGEKGCYPQNRSSRQIPFYVKICKLADIYDAMISKRCYKDALNQIAAVTELFRKYVRKDPMLQFLLHSFVKSIGIHPPGSLVYLKNGQIAYVLESKGPILLPFTDKVGEPLDNRPDPINASQRNLEPGLAVNSEKSVRLTREIYQRLPDYIKRIAMPVA